MFARARVKLRILSRAGIRLSSTASPTRSPKDLYNHLSQYVIGQEAAKKVLSVAVFNHYRRIEPIVNPPTEIPVPPRPAAEETDVFVWDRPNFAPTFDADPTQPSATRDATRVVGAEDGSDPTLTHGGALTPRGEGYFFSRRPPTLLGKALRDGETDPDESKPERLRKRKNDQERRAAQNRHDEEEERVRRAAELRAAVNPPSQDDSGVVVEKSNVLMIGPTGTGKTLMSKTLARALDVPFVSCDATTYTQAGYVGEDVESCILRLLQAADYDVARAEVGIVHIDEVDKLARRGGNEFGTWGGGRDVGGEGVQQALLRILEGTTVTLSAKAPPTTSSPSTPHSTQAPGTPPGSPGSGTKAESSSFDPPEFKEFNPNNPMNRTFGNAPGKKGVREGLPGFSGGGGANKGDQFVVDTSNILFILSGAFVGLEPIIQRRLGKGSIGFGAPLAGPPTQGILKPVTSDLKDYGLIPEFLGRLPIVSSLHPLAIGDLIRILTEPRNALIKQYKALFQRYGSELAFTHRALEAIAHEGLERGGGARGLRGVLEEILVDAMFEVPGSGVQFCLVTKAAVERREPAMYFSRGNRHSMQEVIDIEDGIRRRPVMPEAEEKMRAVG